MTQVTYANPQKSFHLTAVNPQKWAAYTCAHTRKASSADVRILSNIVYGTVRRYVMAESSHNTGALRVSRYEFHLLRIAWVGHVPAT